MPCVGAQSTATESLAEINGDTITTEELNRALGTRLAQIEEQVYNLKSRELDVLIAQRLLAPEAAEQGISVPTLLDAEVTAKVGLVTALSVERQTPSHRRMFPHTSHAWPLLLIPDFNVHRIIEPKTFFNGNIFQNGLVSEIGQNMMSIVRPTGYSAWPWPIEKQLVAPFGTSPLIALRGPQVITSHRKALSSPKTANFAQNARLSRRLA